MLYYTKIALADYIRIIFSFGRTTSKKTKYTSRTDNYEETADGVLTNNIGGGYYDIATESSSEEYEHGNIGKD